MDTKPTLTVREMMSFLNVSRPTAYELVNSPGFPAFRIGKKILINTERLKEWIKQQEVKNHEDQ